MIKEMLTIKEVTEILGVSRTKVYKFINSEKNPLKVIYLAERTPRIKRKDLNTWVERQDKINE